MAAATLLILNEQSWLISAGCWAGLGEEAGRRVISTSAMPVVGRLQSPSRSFERSCALWVLRTYLGADRACRRNGKLRTQGAEPERTLSLSER